MTTSFDGIEMEIECPVCCFGNNVRLKQVRLRDVVICRGCKRHIQLEDYMNRCRKAKQQFQRMMNEFQHTFSNLNLTIRL